MKRTFLAALLAAAVAAAVLAPIHLLADLASCSVNASSFADSVLNPPKGEDTEFFVSSGGGVPNIMFVLDTSGSMLRLPPDGATQSWGAFGDGYGCTNPIANTLTFNSACGNTTLDGSPYNPTPGQAGPDFAQAKDSGGKYCPYMVTGNQPPNTDKAGFDPDFYGGSGGSPWFFEPGKVYHDVIYSPSGAWDGWDDWSTSPTAHATYTDFCNQWTAGSTKATTCVACMRDQGYFFDGSYLGTTGVRCGSTADCKDVNAGTCLDDGTTTERTSGVSDGSAHCKLPHVWFSGNFLNFYPPKFIVARKVLKDVLQSVRKIRLGLTIFSSAGSGGVLLDALNPACNQVGSPSSFDSNRGSILNAINNKNQVGFGGGTPLAETLLDVGQLYLNSGYTWFSTTYKDTNFMEKGGNNKSVCFSCQASAVLLITDGIPSQDGKIPGTDFAAVPMDKKTADDANSIAGMAGYNITGISDLDCPVCNTAAEAADTSVLPGTCVGQQASGACDDFGNPIQSYLPKVAWYLHNMDFRPNTEVGSDGFPLAEKQTVTTYTIGLGTRPTASEILKHTATAGGGLYNGGSGSDVADAKTLKDAILRVLDDVNTRSTSFGAASLSTLQIASSQGVLIPRFEPSRTAHWDGHLFSFDLYSEFAGGCTPQDPATSGPGNKDYDCDGKCSSVFLKDFDGKFISEDGSGAFKKNKDPNLATCGNGSRCSLGSTCSEADPNNPAIPFWDAGAKLAPVKTTIDANGFPTDVPNEKFTTEWDDRKIYTAIDRNGDGKIDRADEGTAGDGAVLELSDANASLLVPYLNLRGTRYCSRLVDRLPADARDGKLMLLELSPVELSTLTLKPVLAACGAASCPCASNPKGCTIPKTVEYTTCAKTLLKFVRGADIFKDRDCATYPTRTNPDGRYCSRRYQLGDIFHSSPIEVWPPLPSDGYSCPRGLHPQCLASLFSNSIPNPSVKTPTANANAYDDYAKDDRYKNRKKFVVVGANDGMLHAFRIERTDPRAGEEIWGFVPPDLLAKVRLLTENVHQFYVDATPMVRDVWLDGIPNELTLGDAQPDGVREAKEFHTVAIVGERRGGTHYFALDITDASSDLRAKPKFLWLYPQPNDPESLSFGETYVEFVPKPPPIGPVKLFKSDAPCEGNYRLDPDGSGKCFEERWIAFLSGGFDPQYTKGRGVHMVDVATGEELWDFSQPAGPASSCDLTKDPRCHLNYPVAATVGMMMWGNLPTSLSTAAVNGYFDTATFGDTGGQLWVLRFNVPGERDATTKKVKNWFGGRVLQMGRDTSPACGLGLCETQPFFYISSNVALAANGLYRTLAGTGDRFNLLDTMGGTCGPENIRACLLKGCTVTIGDGAGGPGAVYGVEPLLGKQTYTANHPSCTMDPASYRFDVTASSGNTCTTITSKIDRITIFCPSTATCGDGTNASKDETTRKTARVVCTGESCEADGTNEFGIPIDLKTVPDQRNWFMSVRVFDTVPPRTIFKTLPEAIEYDKARPKVSDLKNVNAADANPIPGNLATPEGLGWSYYFDHGLPTSNTPVSMAGVNHTVYRGDERTASVSAVEYGCAFWNTIQPGVPVGATSNGTGCPVNSPCKAGRAQISYLYGANAGTGALCLKVDGLDARAQKNETLVPPHIGKLVAYVGEGQVSFGLTSVRVPQGGANVQLGEAQDIAAATEWLPVDRVNHACRHAPKEGWTGWTGTPPPDAVCKQE